VIISSLHGLPAFAAYLVAAIGFCALFLLIYTWITPHREFDLIVEGHNASAAIALGMSLIGFAIPLTAAIRSSASIVDFSIWALVSLVVQIIGYGLARLAHKNLSHAIEQNTIAAAVWLGSVSLTVGIVSASCMTP
jgi:putative membrane protein